MTQPERTLLPGRDLSWGAFARSLTRGFAVGAIDDVAAIAAFYSVVALFPFVIVVVSLASMLASWETIDQAAHDLARVAPREVTVIVTERLTALKQSASAAPLTLGLIGTLWSASSAVASLMPAMNRACSAVETRSFFKRRLLAVAVTVALGAFALAMVLVALGLHVAAARLGGRFGAAVAWLRLPGAGAAMALVWANLYGLLPDVAARLRVVTPGAVVGVALWVLASWAFGQYVGHFGSYEATYGALGGAIVLLLWIWVSAMTFLLGAEINLILVLRGDPGATPSGERSPTAGAPLMDATRHAQRP